MKYSSKDINSSKYFESIYLKYLFSLHPAYERYNLSLKCVSVVDKNKILQINRETNYRICSSYTVTLIESALRLTHEIQALDNLEKQKILQWIKIMTHLQRKCNLNKERIPIIA